MESQSRIMLLQKSMIDISQCRKICHIILAMKRCRHNFPIYNSACIPEEGAFYKKKIWAFYHRPSSRDTTTTVIND